MRIAALALTALTTGGLGMMQTAPPVKMGLWESSEVTTTTMPPAMAEQMKRAMPAGVPVTTKRKYCITPEVWEKAVGLKPPTEACVVSNRSVTGKNATMTLTCTIGGVAIGSDIAITFDSTEAWHGSGHSASTFPPSMMGGGKLTSETTFKATFKGSACGDVKPDHPVVEE